MKYTVDHNKPESICIVRVSGEHKRPEDSLVLQKLARSIRSETGCVRFLYDMRMAAITGNLIDIYKAGVAPEENNFERDFRIAIVFSGNMDDHLFMETVLINRGYNFCVFEDMEEASEWLNK